MIDAAELIDNEFLRQFDIEVKLGAGYGQKRYSGYFNNKNLEAALKMICDPLELNYQMENEYIEIK